MIRLVAICSLKSHVLDWPRTTHCRSNHVARAAGPADVLAWVINRDREVISATVVPLFGAGWTLGHIVVPNRADLGANVVEDPEFWPTRVSPHRRFSLRLW